MLNAFRPWAGQFPYYVKALLHFSIHCNLLYKDNSKDNNKELYAWLCVGVCVRT